MLCFKTAKWISVTHSGFDLFSDYFYTKIFGFSAQMITSLFKKILTPLWKTHQNLLHVLERDSEFPE